MPQTPKDKARQQIAFHEQEIQKLRAFIEVYELLEDPPAIDKLIDELNAAAKAPQGPYATSDEIADAVREILKGETEPMHIGYLYKLVTAKGLRISGQNPKGNLSAKLAPYKDIKYNKLKGGWLLVEPSPKVEAPNGIKPNGASNHGEVDASPNSNPALTGA